MSRALIISDGKPGHFNQARALCGIMDWQSEEIVVQFNSKPMKALSYILDALGLRFPAIYKTDKLEHWEFDVIVAVSSSAYYPAKVIGKEIGRPVIALMYPRGFKTNDFAHIFCPSYDNPPVKKNITTLPITLCNREPSFYEEMTADFAGKFEYQMPAVSVIIGGGNKYGDICPDDIRKKMEQIFSLTPNHQHWLTTSRRTSAAVEEVLESFPFDYKLIYSKEQYNPIPAFIALSDYLFVTSDSSSMISECVSAGSSKVEVLKNQSKKRSKFDSFLDTLQKEGCVHIFDGTLGNADKKVALQQTIRKAMGI